MSGSVGSGSSAASVDDELSDLMAATGGVTSSSTSMFVPYDYSEAAVLRAISTTTTTTTTPSAPPPSSTPTPAAAAATASPSHNGSLDAAAEGGNKEKRPGCEEAGGSGPTGAIVIDYAATPTRTLRGKEGLTLQSTRDSLLMQLSLLSLLYILRRWTRVKFNCQ
ncbi:hypothetical protein Pelo_1960 [Pelomyxa schiedti]|nr:hypothetical protein Pelo_1960 [Pelomyxa schiedti]